MIASINAANSYFSSSSFLVAVVAYRDITDKDKRFEILDFTTKDQSVDFIGKLVIILKYALLLAIIGIRILLIQP